VCISKELESVFGEFNAVVALVQLIFPVRSGVYVSRNNLITAFFGRFDMNVNVGQ
jgi:uncharacterized membrane protein